MHTTRGGSSHVLAHLSRWFGPTGFGPRASQLAPATAVQLWPARRWTRDSPRTMRKP